MNNWAAAGFRLAAVAAATLVTATLASGQQISLRDADPIAKGAAGERAGVYLDQGDVGRGDDRRDLIIGAPGGSSMPGTVYILFGGRVRTGEFNLTVSDVTIRGAANGDQFGRSTAAGNILNEEGVSPRNLVVGAPGAHGGRGAVYLFAPATGFTASTTFTASDAVFQVIGAPGDSLGTALATADLNGDRHRDIIVGAPGNNRVYVIYWTAGVGGVRDLTLQPADLTMTGSAVGDVLTAGDLTGDGRGDIIVGSPTNNKVYFLAGRPVGDFASSINLNTDADAVLSGADTGDRAGASLAVFDIDDDGRRDLAIGAPGADGPSESRDGAGEVYVIWGGPIASRSLAHADVTIFGATIGGGLGSHISTGDVNRDTPNDLVMLAPNGSPGGELNVYYGRSATRLGTARPDGRREVDLAVSGQRNRRIIGDGGGGPITMSFVFEVTGEGSRDIIISVPSADSNAGRVFYSISPRLRVSPNPLTVFVNRGTQATESLLVTNPAPIPLTWAASEDQAWSDVGPTTGSAAVNAPGALQVRADATGLAPGQYLTNVSVRSTSFDATITVRIPVTVRVTDTRIVIDTPASSARVPGTFALAGWAIDPTSTTGTGIDAIQIYADPNPGSGAARMFLGAATYGQSRPDVAAAFGARFQNSGYAYEVTGLAAGTYRLLVFARNTASNTFNALREVTVTVEGTGPTPPAANPADFDGDGRMDLVWQHGTVGWISAWLMDGATLKDAVLFTPSRVADPNWVIVATGDFNGDRKADLVWQHRGKGLISVWLMNGTTLIDAVLVNPSTVSDVDWWIVAAGDLNGDGKPDLVWQHQTKGLLAVWFMNGTTLASDALLSPSSVSDANWKIVGLADMNKDGKPDLVWQHITAGWLATWFMNGISLIDAVLLTPDRVPPVWRIKAVGDLNGDNNADLVWQHQDGWISAWFMNGASLVDAVLLNPGRVSDTNWRIVGPR